MLAKQCGLVCPAAGSRVLLSCIVVFLACLLPAAAVRGENADVWQKFRASEAFAIMRHAIAPGTGDPAAFDIQDCATQRNLSADGRRQAERAGDLFRNNGVSQAAVHTSQWCRCLETARLLDLGPVSELPALNSFFGQSGKGPQQTKELEAWLSGLKPGRPRVLVSHQVNISALLGRGARSGEIIFVQRTADGQFHIAGSIVP